MRHKNILSKNDALLLVIDYQEKLLKAFSEPDELLSVGVKMIKFAHIMNLPIVWTEQYPKGLGGTIASIKNELPDLKPIEKNSFSCFGEARFTNELARIGKNQLLICGIETHICIEQTALDAIEAGYQPQILSDACGSRKKKDHKTGLRKMESAGTILTCSEMAMYEILKGSEADEFRRVLPLVR